MKKIKFLNGMSVACAFAVVAMIGAFLFTSCEKEDLNATFEAGPAEITFNVKVYDVLSGNVTDKATVTGADKISQNGGYAGGKVTITATYDGATGTADVMVYPLKAGGKATYDVTVIVSSKYKIAAKLANSETKIGYLKNASHSHNGYNWCLNDNEYVLSMNLKYDIEHKQVTEVSEGAAEFVATLAKGMEYDSTEKDVVFPIKVSAWSYYRIWTTCITTTTEYTITRENGTETFGVIKATSTNSTAAEYEETAFNSHYHYGHGHGVHGDDANAGGGIIYGD